MMFSTAWTLVLGAAALVVARDPYDYVRSDILLPLVLLITLSHGNGNRSLSAEARPAWLSEAV